MIVNETTAYNNQETKMYHTSGYRATFNKDQNPQTITKSKPTARFTI